MHTEVHVHGTVLLKSGVSQTDIELALRHWFDYVDVDGLADARSAHQDEPGIVFDRRRRSLDICWTGYVGRNFQHSLEGAFESLSPYSEEAAAVEVSYYQEDGQDEHSWVFVGPTRRRTGPRSVPAVFPEKSTCTRNGRRKWVRPAQGGFQLFHRNPLIS